MIKVKILENCELCKGAGYFPVREERDYKGQCYMKYSPCSKCEGSGLAEKFVDLSAFKKLLDESVCQHQHISRVGGYHNSPDGVWDDIQDVCDGCGKVLD